MGICGPTKMLEISKHLAKQASHCVHNQVLTVSSTALCVMSQQVIEIAKSGVGKVTRNVPLI